MDYTIFVYGSVSWMREMLIGISAIFGYGGSGTALFGSYGMNMFIMICFAIGLLVAILKSMMAGSSPFEGVAKHLVIYFVFLIMFGVSTSVRLVDAKDTSRMATVDGLPIGLVIPASMISTFSRFMAFQFSEAMPSPYSIETGDYDPYREASFLSSLQTLMAIRDVGASNEILDRVQSSYDGQPISLPSKTLEVYITRCTMTGVSLGHKELADITQGMMPEALRFDSEVYRVEITEGNTVSCTEAWNYVGANNGSSVFSALRTTNNTTYRLLLALATNVLTPEEIMDPSTSFVADVAGGWNALVASMDSSTAETELESIGRSLRDMGILGSNPELGFMAADALDQAQRAIFTSVVQPIFFQAQAGHFTNANDPVAAMAIQEAIQQRNTRWAASQSLFMNVIEPLSAVFETFIWIIIPFISGAILLGFGLGLLGKVAMTLVSVALWMPILIVIDRFIRTGISDALRKQPDIYEHGMTTFYTLDSVAATAENWIAVGGMLAAATPMLAMMLMTGSSMAAVNIANRMSTADQDFDVDKVSPKVAENSSALKVQSGMSSDRELGYRQTGSESNAVDINTGEILSNTEAEDTMLVRSSGSELANTLIDANKDGQSHQITNGLTEASSAARASTNSSTLESRYSESRDWAEQFSDSDTVQESIAAIDSAVAGGTLSAGRGAAGIKAALQSNVEWKDTYSSGIEQRTQESEGVSASLTESERAEFQTSFGEQLSTNFSENWTDGMSTEQTDSVSAAHRESEQAIQRHQVNRGLQSSMGGQRNVNSQQLMNRFLQDDSQSQQGRQMLQNQWTNQLGEMAPEERETTMATYDNLRERLQEHDNLTPEQANTRAKVEMMAESQAGFTQDSKLGLTKAQAMAYGYDYRELNGPGEAPENQPKPMSEDDTPPIVTRTNDEARALERIPDEVSKPESREMQTPEGDVDAVRETNQAGAAAIDTSATETANEDHRNRNVSSAEEVLPEVQTLAGASESKTNAMSAMQLFQMGKHNHALAEAPEVSGQVPATYHNALQNGMTNGQAMYMAGVAGRDDKVQETAMQMMSEEVGGGELGQQYAEATSQFIDNKYMPGTGGMTGVATPLSRLNQKRGAEVGATDDQRLDGMRQLSDVAAYRPESSLAGDASMNSAEAVLSTGVVGNSGVAAEIAGINQQISAAEESGSTTFDRDLATEYISALAQMDQTSTAAETETNYNFDSEGVRPDFESADRRQIEGSLNAVRAMSRGEFEEDRGIANYAPDPAIADASYEHGIMQDQFDANIFASQQDPVIPADYPMPGTSGSDQVDRLYYEADQSVENAGTAEQGSGNGGSRGQPSTGVNVDNMQEFLAGIEPTLTGEQSVNLRANEVNARSDHAAEARARIMAQANIDPVGAIEEFNDLYRE